ncbi:glycosyltransferase family 39 protein [Caldilinea sp.]|jgi:hypothetical protein|uniref:ArnT family glycosyltransferase n=1 Tax=Caldilinea sp. TaxID=2293560 RepID=UPI0021DF00AA|nr:hypothetical protein [Caldilinea sp.]GIV69751.1 MAG: hypothetical protein KatS3mg048_2613 [Caldilinea sp.]
MKAFNSLLSSRYVVFILTLCIVIGHSILWLDEINRLLPVIGMLLIAVFVPGWILWALLRPSSLRPVFFLEGAVLGAAFGYAIFVIVSLWLSYLPGGLNAWVLLATFNLITLTSGLAWLHKEFRFRSEPNVQFTEARSYAGDLKKHWRGVIAFLVPLSIAIYLRLKNLGYSEFQGDEAKMIMQAIGVLHGQEEVLFLHRKGPAEVLVPAVTFAFTSSMTELTARIPFFFLHFLFISIVVLFGKRIGGSWVGWLAAMLLAVDGMHVGLGRIVQYTGFIYLMSAATVYTMLELKQHHEKFPDLSNSDISRMLLFASIFASVGLLAHYEGALIIFPSAYILWRLYKEGVHWKRLLQSLIAPLSFAFVILGSFYIPFLTNPQIIATAEYFNSAVVGLGSTLYNNLSDFWQRSILYTAAPVIVFALAFLVLAIVLPFWRAGGKVYQTVAGLVILVSVWLVFHPSPLIVQGADLSLIAHLVLICAAVAAPYTTVYPRMLWLWFAPVWVLAIFVFKDPGLHYYDFYLPWMLLVALTFNNLRLTASSKIGQSTVNGIAVLFLLLVFATGFYYAQRVFVEHDPEVVRNWRHQSVLPSWLAITDPENIPKMGMPHKSGWKTVGVLYEDNLLQGSYASNMRRWITDWYTRGSEYCESMPDYVLVERGEREREQAKLFKMMGDAYAHWGTVYVAGDPRLDIYKRGSSEGSPKQFDNEDYEEIFDKRLSTPVAGYVAPSVSSVFRPVSFRFGNEIELTGVYLPVTSTIPAGYLDLSLRYRVLQQPQYDYTLFLQIIGDNNRMIGQRDRPPTCDGEETTAWKTSAEIVGTYRIPIFANSPTGQYPLWIGMYNRLSGERVLIYDSADVLVGDALWIGDVTVGAGP